MNRVYVVIINWNGWRDTLECLESLLRSDYPDLRVVVCDNGSHDGSMSFIKAWAEGLLDVLPQREVLRHLSFPPVPKPVSYIEYGRTDAESGGAGDDNRLVLINTGGNLGFAGGNNVGLRYILARNDFSYAWLLNNDTVVEPNALSELVMRIGHTPSAGMCGSTIRYYENSSRFQALGGGYYCKWVGLPWHYGRIAGIVAPSHKRAEKRMNYIEGAALFVSRAFLLEVGLMCEDYFLYFEEADWAIRAKGRYTLAYAPASVVYHKVGASIGTRTSVLQKSYTCDYYSIRNRLFFTRRFYPAALPTIWMTVIAALFLRVVCFRFRHAAMIWKLLVAAMTPGGLTGGHDVTLSTARDDR